MKKILSLLLVGVMMFSMIPAAYATTNYTNGTQVEYDAADDDTIGDSNNDGSPDNVEYYTVTVPAQLAPGGSGDVTAKGTWASNRKLNVTADATVTLANTISGADEKVLDVTFPGISLVGSNTAAVTDTKVVSVGDIAAALFGTWEGVFEYNVEMVDVLPEYVFTASDYDAKMGTTTKTNSTVVIPETFTYDATTYQITSIGPSAFSSCHRLASVTIPDSVTSIGQAAFGMCEMLTSVNIPDGVTSIEKSTFSYCIKLSKVDIPASVTSIGENAFANCNELTAINFAGTMEQWNAIELDEDWNFRDGEITVICTDGTVIVPAYVLT